MTFLTGNSRLRPSTDKAWEAILVALWFITSSVARPTIVRSFLAWMVAYPVLVSAENLVREVILRCGILVSSDDVSV
jgi:hypothetical protein